MFPNDDICNIKAARNAAKRIFQKYKSPVQKQSSNNGLAKQQVQTLIKNAYDAINIPYDPSAQDAFSFMSVFGVDNNGTIELDRLEELAVKYLCGEQTFFNDQNTVTKQLKHFPQEYPQRQSNISIQKDQFFTTQSKFERELKKEIYLSEMQKLSLQQNLGKYKQGLDQRKQNKIRQNSQTGNQNRQNRTKVNEQSSYPINPFLSPKVNGSKKMFTFQSRQSVKLGNQSQNNIPTKKKYSDILNDANSIFNSYKNNQKQGITINQAGEVLKSSYKLVGKKKFIPSQEDIKIWMKLCDTKRNGIIDWISYQNFMKRLLERQNISHDN